MTYKKISVNDDDGQFLRTRDMPNIQTLSIDSIKEMARELSALSMPSGKDFVVKELTGLSLGMARRKDHEEDYRGMLIVYAGDLAEYPQDVIREAFSEIRRERTFFPTIAELRKACEERYEFRRALNIELQALLSGRKQLEAPDERTGVHYKALAKKDWLPIHYDYWVEEAAHMIRLSKETRGFVETDGWQAEYERRVKERDALLAA